MDSFVLAETFKYLYLLFSDKDTLLVDVDEFVFSTEAHFLPLFLSAQTMTHSERNTNSNATSPTLVCMTFCNFIWSMLQCFVLTKDSKLLTMLSTIKYSLVVTFNY